MKNIKTGNGFTYFYELLLKGNPEKLSPLLNERIKAVHSANMSSYNDEVGSFRGHIKLTHNGAIYHPCNLAPLVIIPGAIAYLSNHNHINERDLERILSSLNWLHHNLCVEIEPGVVGVLEPRDGDYTETWVKYTAEKAHIEARMYQFLTRLQQPDREIEFHRKRAIHHGEFLILAAQNDFSVKYRSGWLTTGWLSYGRVIRGFYELYKITHNSIYIEFAIKYGEKLLETIASYDGPYFRNEEGLPCFDSDISADPLRGLILCHLLSGEKKYITQAMKLGDWLVTRQFEDGEYPLRIFKDPELNEKIPSLKDLRNRLEGRVEPGSALHLIGIASPGDTANITMALIELWESTGKLEAMLPGIIKGIAYCLYTQNMDRDSFAFGFPPSWRPTKSPLLPFWESVDSTYSGDQGGLLVQAYLKYKHTFLNSNSKCG